MIGYSDRDKSFENISTLCFNHWYPKSSHLFPSVLSLFHGLIMSLLLMGYYSDCVFFSIYYMLMGKTNTSC